MWRFFWDILEGSHKNPSASETLREELVAALHDAWVAENHFREATRADFIDGAIYSGLAACSRVQGLLRLIKTEDVGVDAREGR